MSKTVDAGTVLDRRDLLLYLHSLTTEGSTADRMMHVALRAIHRHFAADTAVITRLDASESPVGKQYRYPKRPPWSVQDLTELRAGSLADLPRGEIFALLRRKERAWAIAGLRRLEAPFDGDDLELLKEAARILSRRLARFDRNRVVAIRARIDRKLIEPIRPNDLFYQVLHGLRSLTGYDHSASLYMLTEPRPLPYDLPFPVEMQIVAELLGPHTKSPRVGQERELAPELVRLLGEGGTLRCRRTEEEWATPAGSRGAELSRALDSGHDLGDYGRERSMICAPLISQDALVGFLKIGFRHSGLAGSYEADLVREFVPHFVVALRNLRRLEHLSDELDAARRFQASLLPAPHHVLPGGAVTYRYRPCDALGGDFFDVVAPAPDRTQLLLADVSGHGAKAAMLTALIKATFRDKSRSLDPAATLREIWASVRYLDPELMVTAFCLEIDWTSRALRWGNAGHPPPILEPGGGTTEIEAGEQPIFASAEFQWTLHRMPLPPGGRILVYTDGLTEAEAEPADEFGAQRLAEVAVRAAGGEARGGSPPAAAQLESIFRAVDEHRGGAAQADDYTAALVSFDD